MLVGDRRIRMLNRDFRAKDESTDVLSFPQFDEATDDVAPGRGRARPRRARPRPKVQKRERFADLKRE